MLYKELWPGWETVRLIGRGGFGTVYEIEREVFGHKEKAALKVISIPQSENDIEELLSDGYDEESITRRFEGYLHDIIREYTMMAEMKGCANIVYCDDVKYIQHDNGMGWDIFIKMELLTPLTKALGKNVTDEQVIKIGADICNALAFCEKRNVLHRDIKPQNVFVALDGTYKLGDFGIAKTAEKTTSGTKTGTYKYMAPEVYNNQPYGGKADIYSLGLVLYWLLNERRTPFLPLPPTVPSATEEDTARGRRFRGEAIPKPKHGSEELKRIVLKACAYDSHDRYQSATEMLRDLEQFEGRRDEDTETTVKDGILNYNGARRKLDTESTATDQIRYNGQERTARLDSGVNDATVAVIPLDQQAKKQDGTNQASNSWKSRIVSGRVVAIAGCLLLAVVVLLTIKNKNKTGETAQPGSETTEETVSLDTSDSSSSFSTNSTSVQKMDQASTSAPTGEVYRYDGLTYNYGDNKLTVSGKGVVYTGSEAIPIWEKEIKPYVKEIILEEGVTGISDWAFEGCRSLTTITFPDSLTSIGEWVFQNCSKMSSIMIPQSVTSIGAGAFENCSKLVSITLPNGLKSISWYIFNGCDHLKSISIPESVTFIDDGAFNGCRAMSEVHYSGSSEQWKAITVIGAKGTNVSLSNAAVYFNETITADTGGKNSSDASDSIFQNTYRLIRSTEYVGDSDTQSGYTEYSYDSDGRVTAEGNFYSGVLASGWTYEYNADGFLSRKLFYGDYSANYGPTFMNCYYYNDAGVLMSEVLYAGDEENFSNAEGREEYSYYEGRIIERKHYGFNYVISYRYEYDHDLLKTISAFGQDGTPCGTTVFAYDDQGRLIRKDELDSKQYTEYYYDQNGNLSEEIEYGSGSVNRKIWYEYELVFTAKSPANEGSGKSTIEDYSEYEGKWVSGVYLSSGNYDQELTLHFNSPNSIHVEWSYYRIAGFTADFAFDPASGYAYFSEVEDISFNAQGYLQLEDGCVKLHFDQSNYMDILDKSEYTFRVNTSRGGPLSQFPDGTYYAIFSSFGSNDTPAIFSLSEPIILAEDLVASLKKGSSLKLDEDTFVTVTEIVSFNGKKEYNLDNYCRIACGLDGVWKMYSASDIPVTKDLGTQSAVISDIVPVEDNWYYLSNGQHYPAEENLRELASRYSNAGEEFYRRRFELVIEHGYITSVTLLGGPA